MFASHLEFETCCACGVVFATPKPYFTNRRQDQTSFYCPNGHSQSYTKSTADILREQLAATELRLQAQINEATHARLVAEKAQEKALKDKREVERRIAHGICPCCNKTFGNVVNHMLTEHQDFRLPAGKKQKQIEAT